MKFLKPSAQFQAALTDNQIQPEISSPLPPSLPQEQTQEATNQSESVSSPHGHDGSHIDELIEKAEPQAIAEPVNVQLDKGNFHKLFCGVFVMSSHLSGLNSLYVDEGDGKARAASEAIYDTILEIPALHFLIQPGGQKMQRIIAIGMFALPMAKAVSDEIGARRGKGAIVANAMNSNPFPQVNMGA